MSDDELKSYTAEIAKKYGVNVELSQPRHKSRAKINGEMLFDFTAPLPNWFRRFWYWALLGWTWESLE